MASTKMIGVLLSSLTFGTLTVRAEAPPSDKGKAANPADKKGGLKSCGGANGCGAVKDDKGSAGAKDKDKGGGKTDDKKGGGLKSCGGANGCGAKK